MQTDVVILDELTRFESDGLSLEGRLAYPESANPTFAALIAGAHPLLGGREENNVADAVRTGLAAAGAVAMTFNYRGVGGSEAGGFDWERMIADFWREGRVPEEQLWLSDAKNALNHLRTIIDAPKVLVGYSFGCWVISQLAAAANPPATILISPNPTQHDLSGVDTASAPLLVVSSDNDFSCPLDSLQAWFTERHDPKRHALLPGAEHFFRQREAEVVENVCNFLNECGVMGTSA